MKHFCNKNIVFALRQSLFVLLVHMQVIYMGVGIYTPALALNAGKAL